MRQGCCQAALEKLPAQLQSLAGQWGLWDSVSLLLVGLLPRCPLPHCPLPPACCHGEQIWSCTLKGPVWLFSARVICCHCGHHNNWAFSSLFFFFLIHSSLYHVSFSAASIHSCCQQHDVILLVLTGRQNPDVLCSQNCWVLLYILQGYLGYIQHCFTFCL